MFSILLWLSATTLGAAPAACDWQMDTAASRLGFRGQYQGEPFDGRYQRFQANICFDSAALADAKFNVEIDITSVSTDNEERDDALAGEEFFDFANFPKANFVSKAFRRTDDGKIIADGELTLRGKTQEVALTVDWKEEAGQARLIVTTQLDRLAFGIGSGDWADPELIGAMVDVRGELQLARKAASP